MGKSKIRVMGGAPAWIAYSKIGAPVMSVTPFEEDAYICDHDEAVALADRIKWLSVEVVPA